MRVFYDQLRRPRLHRLGNRPSVRHRNPAAGGSVCFSGFAISGIADASASYGALSLHISNARS